MADKCPACGSCGMPLEKPEDFALGDPKSLYCSACTDRQGKLLPYEEIVAMNAQYYVQSQGITPNAAHHMAKALLDGMPAWKGRTSQLRS